MWTCIPAIAPIPPVHTGGGWRSQERRVRGEVAAQRVGGQVDRAVGERVGGREVRGGLESGVVAPYYKATLTARLLWT